MPVKRSLDMVTAMKNLGAKDVRFTVYPNAAHDSWTEAYNNAELYEWLLKQNRKARAKPAGPPAALKTRT